MAVLRLNGIDLDNSFVWLERHRSFEANQQVERSLGGNLIVYSGGLSKGQLITLEGNEDHGWISLTVLQSLEALAKVPGAIYLFEIVSDTFNVVFRHNDPPALDMRALIPRTGEQGTDTYTGQIKLITV